MKPPKPGFICQHCGKRFKGKPVNVLGANWCRKCAKIG